MTQKRQKRSDELIDEILAESGLTPEAILGESGVMAMLKKRLIERALAGELTHHLGYGKGQAPEVVENYRNGSSPKTVITGEETLQIAVRAIVRAALSRNSSARVRGASKASIGRSSRCMRGG